MPPTEVVYFEEANGSCPLLDWLDDPRAVTPKVRDKCIVRVERLQEHGFELRRPDADLLRDGIYELRVRMGSVNYRMLYFFESGKAVITHGITKEDAVPDREIDLAIRRREMFRANPEKHTHAE